MSEQEPEASVPELAPLPTPDPDFPESGRTEIRAQEPPAQMKFTDGREDG